MVNEKINKYENYLSKLGVGELGSDSVFKLFTHGSSTGHDSSDGGKVVLIHHRTLRNRQHDRRDERCNCDLILINKLQQFDYLKLLHNQNCCTNSQSAEQNWVQRVDVEQWQHAEDDVLTVEIQVGVFAVDLLGHAGDLPPVGQHHSFREPGSAGWVRKRDDIVRVDFHGGEVGLVGVRQLREVQATLRWGVDAHDLHVVFLCETHRFPGVASLGDYQPTLRCFRLLLDLGRHVKRIRRRACCTDIWSPQKCEHELGTILQQKHYHFALLDPHLVEAGADSPGCELHIRVCINISVSAVDHTRPWAELRYILKAIRVQRKMIWDVNIRQFRPENDLPLLLLRLLLFLDLHWWAWITETKEKGRELETKGKVRFWLSFPGGFEFWLGVIYKCLLVQGWWEGDRRNFTFAPRRRQIRTRHVIKKFRCLWGLRAFWLMRRLLIGCCEVGEMGLKVGAQGSWWWKPRLTGEPPKECHVGCHLTQRREGGLPAKCVGHWGRRHHLPTTPPPPPQTISTLDV